MSEFQTKLHSVPSGGFLTDRDKDLNGELFRKKNKEGADHE